MAATAALEVALHGWDISRACGQRQPIPRFLAIDLLAIAPLLVPRARLHPLFAAPVAVAATACPSDRLAAFLGRSPDIAPRPETGSWPDTSRTTTRPETPNAPADDGGGTRSATC